MRYISKLGLVAALGAFLLGMPSSAIAQTVSTCDRALGEAYLDVNNVRARILNTGGLFYRGEPHVYEVPKGSGSNAIFNSGIWIAGQVAGQLRASATRYGEWELWAGPLSDDGSGPVDCSVYDRVYKVSKVDVEAYDLDGSTTPDLSDWPTGLGAPTLDADGEPISILDQPLTSRQDRKINLAAGERPAILGDQTIWAVMNDRGNVHTSTSSPSIGLEVHLTAFAFDVAGDIGNTTFYKFNLFYKGSVPLTESYITIWSDPDLGDFGDDYVGSDSTLGLGYVYNSDNFDISSEGYGTPPPAAGYDFFQGPIVPSVGDTAHVSGRPVPDFKNLGMTTYQYWNSGGGATGGPGNGQEYYNYMQSIWLDGKPVTEGGNGYGFSNKRTNFMFSGDPAVQGFWTEINSDGAGGATTPGDRRFAMSSGPFTINPGDQQEVVFGLVFAKGADNWDSVRALRDADVLAQAAFDVNFELPSPPARPLVKAIPGNNSVTIEWGYAPNANNYLESYTSLDPFAPLEDPDYQFEGYKVIQYLEETDQVGQWIATYDVKNGITRVIDGIAGQPSYVAANGGDNGVSHTHVVGGLTNSKTYYFGIQAYAFNEGSSPKVFNGPVARFSTIPRRPENLVSQDAVEAAVSEYDFIAEAVQAGQGVVTATIQSPGSVLVGAEYVVNMYAIEGAGKGQVATNNGFDPTDERYVENPVGKNGAVGDVTYDITRTYNQQTTKVFNGNLGGNPAPLRQDVILIDGLSFSVTGPAPGMLGFMFTANGAGPLDPVIDGAFGTYGYPVPNGTSTPPSQQTNGSTWIITNFGTSTTSYGDEAGPFNDCDNGWVGCTVREGQAWDNVGSDDYEIRFEQACLDTMNGVIEEGDCVGYYPFQGNPDIEIPFSIWNTGTTSDPSDDYRMIPGVYELHDTPDVWDIGGDRPESGGDNDPFTDGVYWYKPADDGAAAGEAGYNDFFFGDADHGVRVFSRQIFMSWNGGSAPPYDAPMLEAGTVFKYNTKKPNQPGDTFTLRIDDELEGGTFGVVAASDSLKKSRLADINVVPNPYMGVSDYERSQLIDEVRFSNLPLEEPATLRVFTLSGTLINTLKKPAGTNQLTWSLITENNLPIASGMYLIHVEVEGLGTHVIKFAAIKKRIQLNVF